MTPVMMMSPELLALLNEAWNPGYKPPLPTVAPELSDGYGDGDMDDG